MKKRILTLGLALAISLSGATRVFAVTPDPDNDSTDSTTTQPAAAIDESKITSSNPSAKSALITTLEHAAETPDTSSENGRKIVQLLNSVKQGHTLSINVVVVESPEITSNAQAVIAEKTAGLNLAAIDEIKFVVDDSGNTIELSELVEPVSVIMPVPSPYKSELSQRSLEVVRIFSNNNGSYAAEDVSGVKLDNNGDVAFDTADFGHFVLAYGGEPIVVTADGDTSVPSTSAAGANTSTPATPAPAATTTVAAVTIPDTSGFFGIDLTVFHLLLIVGVSLVVIMIIAYAIRRAYIRSRISLK